MTDKIKANIKELALYVIIIVVVILFRMFIATPIIVDGESMNPTLNNNDVMILNKLATIDRYDIVVVKVNGETLIKRVIGLPGETIECVNGEILINGEVIEDKTEELTADFELVVIDNGKYFIMGDNRGDSKDSRMIGTVSSDEIMGTTRLIIWPLRDFGNV